MSSPLKEGVKEFGRIALLAVIPVLVVSLEQPEFSWKAVLVAAILAVLKSADKYVHEAPEFKANGIVPF